MQAVPQPVVPDCVPRNIIELGLNCYAVVVRQSCRCVTGHARPLRAVLVEKSDPSQEELAGKSTLNRLELTQATAQERNKKIVLDHVAVDGILADLLLAAHPQAPQQIIQSVSRCASTLPHFPPHYRCCTVATAHTTGTLRRSVQRQIATVSVVAVTEAPFLPPVQRIIGCIAPYGRRWTSSYEETRDSAVRT
jgi:hypothetical protein